MCLLSDETRKSEGLLGVVVCDSDSGASVVHKLLRTTGANKTRVGAVLSRTPPIAGTSTPRGVEATHYKVSAYSRSQRLTTAVLLLAGGNAESLSFFNQVRKI